MCESYTYIIIGQEQSAKVFSAKFFFFAEINPLFEFSNRDIFPFLYVCKSERISVAKRYHSISK